MLNWDLQGAQRANSVNHWICFVLVSERGYEAAREKLDFLDLFKEVCPQRSQLLDKPTHLPYLHFGHIVTRSMMSRKRPASQSSDETYFDDPLDEEVDSEWEKITQDPVKQVAFERRCIEDELTNEKRVIILQENPSTRSHCRF
ncbi:hypothetical protein BDW75DRAFT_216858 [Aspergillus navahoensis]